MTTKWSHLPNAKYIDLVLASIKSNPDEWDAAWSAAWSAALDAALNAALNAVRGAVRGAAWNAAWHAAQSLARDAAYDAARDAILALIAYDDCAHMLDSEPDELRILSKLGVTAASFMIPAATVFKSIRQTCIINIS